jgi:glycosyltransferase involved in cell wall biosynthesis
VLVPPGDVGATADALRLLLEDVGTRRRFGMAGRERVESQTWDLIAQQVSEVYTDATS